MNIPKHKTNLESRINRNLDLEIKKSQLNFKKTGLADVSDIGVTSLLFQDELKEEEFNYYKQIDDLTNSIIHESNYELIPILTNLVFKDNNYHALSLIMLRFLYDEVFTRYKCRMYNNILTVAYKKVVESFDEILPMPERYFKDKLILEKSQSVDEVYKNFYFDLRFMLDHFIIIRSDNDEERPVNDLKDTLGMKSSEISKEKRNRLAILANNMIVSRLELFEEGPIRELVYELARELLITYKKSDSSSSEHKYRVFGELNEKIDAVTVEPEAFHDFLHQLCDDAVKYGDLSFINFTLIRCLFDMKTDLQRVCHNFYNLKLHVKKRILKPYFNVNKVSDLFHSEFKNPFNLDDAKHIKLYIQFEVYNLFIKVIEKYRKTIELYDVQMAKYFIANYVPHFIEIQEMFWFYMEQFVTYAKEDNFYARYILPYVMHPSDAPDLAHEADEIESPFLHFLNSCRDFLMIGVPAGALEFALRKNDYDMPNHGITTNLFRSNRYEEMKIVINNGLAMMDDFIINHIGGTWAKKYEEALVYFDDSLRVVQKYKNN